MQRGRFEFLSMNNENIENIGVNLATPWFDMAEAIGPMTWWQYTNYNKVIRAK